MGNYDYLYDSRPRESIEDLRQQAAKLEREEGDDARNTINGLYDRMDGLRQKARRLQWEEGDDARNTIDEIVGDGYE